GHWSYPEGTTKAVFVIANTQSGELFLNGKSIAVCSPVDGFIFQFPDVQFAPGKLEATGSNDGKDVCRQTLETTGVHKRIKLTPILGPAGWQADGQDVALVDVEVVDDQGRRCPTDDARIDFTLTGPAIWRGGYNSGRLNSTNNLYLNTECGINRVAIRSTLAAGKVTITATREGLEPGEVEISTKLGELNSGLTNAAPRRLSVDKPRF